MIFSIVICTYNRATYLIQTLESIGRQDFSPADFEVLVVDNNSTDTTEERVKLFIEQFPCLQLNYLKEPRQGVSYARNLGVNKAKGDYIVFIDDDETVAPDFLKSLSAFFRNYPQAKLVAEPVIPVFETEMPRWFSPYTARLITGAYDQGERVKVLKAKDYPGTGHATFKRELFFEYGDFNTKLGRSGGSLMGGEDKDFFLRLINKGIACYYVPEACIYHHIPEYKLTDAFFNTLTLSIGKSERIRTLSVSGVEYRKRLLSEAMKWGATLLLFTFYTLTFRYIKGKKLVLFRKNVTKGLLSK